MSKDPADCEQKQCEETRRSRPSNVYIYITARMDSPISGVREAFNVGGSNIETWHNVHGGELLNRNTCIWKVDGSECASQKIAVERIQSGVMNIKYMVTVELN